MFIGEPYTPTILYALSDTGNASSLWRAVHTVSGMSFVWHK